MADSKNSELDSDLLEKLGATVVPPDSEFQQELRRLYAAAVEYVRNNSPSDMTGMRALERIGIFDSPTPEDYMEKRRTLLLSAPIEDPRVKALAVVLHVERLKQHVDTWKSRMPGADDRSVHAIAFSFPYPELKEAEEAIRLEKELIAQENETAFQAVFKPEMEAQSDVAPPCPEAGEICAAKERPERPPPKKSKRKKRNLALEIKQGGAKGGRLSGEARRRKADSTWVPHALELALMIRKDHPDISQERLAADIEAGWKLSDVRCPTARTLKDHIAKWEQQKRLPSRQTSNPLHPAK